MTNNTESLLFIDKETASNADLAEVGLARYLDDPTTRATCFTWRFPDMPAAELWETGQPVPARIVQHLAAGGAFVAHNAPFDFHIWNRVLRRDPRYTNLPELQVSQVRCSAARARYNGLPGSLEGACEAMGLAVQKDTEAKPIMLLLAAHPEYTPQTHPAEYARLYKYALTDTDAMFGLWYALVPLPALEQQFFELHMQVSDRGFGCDVEGAQAMEDLTVFAEAQLNYDLAVATQGGVLSVTEVAKIKDYAATMGEDMDDAGRETLKTIVARPELPQALREVLALRLDASRAPKKAKAILRAHTVTADGPRMRHATIYHGALSGRTTARGCGGVQLLNVARPRPGHTSEQCEAYLEAAKRHDLAFLSSPEVGPVLAALADAQRALFRAVKPGHTLVGADLSGIEAHMASWLANDEEKLSNFEKGIDSYKVAAMPMFGVEYEAVTKDQRQIGKVGDLSLTFGGGDGAFVSMAANYGVHLEPEVVSDIVWKWREARPAFERWWAVLEYAVLIALDQPGRRVKVPVGRGWCSEVVFVRDARALRMELPSGRAISYHNARLYLDPGASAPIAIYDKPEGYVETLDRKILSNNMTQGLSRDLFWLIMLSAAKVEDIVHEVYDELIMEVPVERAHQRLEQLLARMRIAPHWCPGLPLEAAGYVADCWRKD
jgi:DNA polymerase